jgi:fructose-1,6-bisphosphatase
MKLFQRRFFISEEQKKLDILSNDIMKKILYDNVKYIISEEDALVTECNLSSNLIVAIDPLDGSSNIDCNIPVGTIFGVFLIDDNNNILDSTNNIIASGYVLYSSSTELVITTGDGTHQFTYYPVNENYYLTKDKSIQVKKSLINIFSDLFANTPIYNEIRKILLNEFFEFVNLLCYVIKISHCLF